MILVLRAIHSFLLFRNISYIWYTLCIITLWFLFFFHRGSLLSLISTKYLDELTFIHLILFPISLFAGGEYKRTMLRLDRVSPAMDWILKILIYSNLLLLILTFLINSNIIVILTHLNSLGQSEY